MKILINASNIGGTGGVQAVDSIVRHLGERRDHSFVAVLPSAMAALARQTADCPNVKALEYDYPARDLRGFATGRNAFLDGVAASEGIDCVLTVFGPMKWRPRCPHVAGFALSQMVTPESPYMRSLPFAEHAMLKLRMRAWKTCFGRADALYSENEAVTERLRGILPSTPVFTVSNCCHQVFDEPGRWEHVRLPSFRGVQILYAGTAAKHKNLPILIGVARYLRRRFPGFVFRFVLTVEHEELPGVDAELESNFCFVGRVGIEACPSLYEQCGVVAMPSLLESFSAIYPEAMRMRRPIVAADLPFARGICGDAAAYYPALSAEHAAMQIHAVATSESLRERLISAGERRLAHFGDSRRRADKLLELCELTVKGRL